MLAQRGLLTPSSSSAISYHRRPEHAHVFCKSATRPPIVPPRSLQRLWSPPCKPDTPDNHLHAIPEPAAAGLPFLTLAYPRQPLPAPCPASKRMIVGSNHSLSACSHHCGCHNTPPLSRPDPAGGPGSSYSKALGRHRVQTQHGETASSLVLLHLTGVGLGLTRSRRAS